MQTFHVVILSGRYGDDVQWMVTDFAENSRPVDFLIRKDFSYRKWQRFKSENLLPYLTKVHEIVVTAQLNPILLCLTF